MTHAPTNGPSSPSGCARIALRALGVCALAAALLGSPARADDLPSPDAMALGALVVPGALVQGYRAGIEESVLERVSGAVPAADRPAFLVRARAALAPLLDEAFPPELLAGLGAQFLGTRYAPEELRALRAREESALGRKLRDFERRAAEIVVDSPASRDRAREALARETFSATERRELEGLEASGLGAKGLALAPDLAAYFVDALDRHYRSIEPELGPRLRRVAEAALPAR